jgi:DNA repair exonuclease SbcCD nuclease subunit
MKILFSADWHLKLGAKNVPTEWAKARYLGFFEQIHSISREADIHIIGGDLFDRVPTLEELSLYFQFIKNCEVETLIYSGNHESTKKFKTFLSELKEASSAVNGLVRIIDEAYEDPRGFSILPYCDLHKKNSIEMMNEKLPLFTHVRGEIPPHVTPEVNLERFDRFPVVFAGDLHSHSNCQRNIVYPGSPMTTSFHRTPVETGVIMIVEDWDWYFERLSLPQLIRKTVKSTEEMVPGIYDHVIYEVEGDMADLATVKASDLLDKKVVKRASEATLILTKEMTIAEELIEYLSYVLELSEDKIPSIIKVYNDYSKNSEMG